MTLWRVRALLVTAAVVCIAALALTARPGTSRLALRYGPQGRATTRLPVSLAAAASASIGASDQHFWPVRRGDSLLAQGGGIRSTFTASGAALRVLHGTLGLSLAAVGRGQLVAPVPAVAPTGAGSEVVYRHGSVTEFYRNGPYGLEQGSTVARRPLAGTGSLGLALRVDGSLSPKQAGSQVLFRTAKGVTALQYGQLSARDATGRRLAAWMEVRDGRVEVRIDDSHARYPLRIDPFIQQGSKLTGSGESGKGGFGEGGVALSSDGNTALIAGDEDNGRVGAVWVFTRSGSTWTQQGAKLKGSGESGIGLFGSSVALSSDGNTALIGGSFDNSFTGAAWVFTRSGSTWTQQGAKLTGSGESGTAEFGNGVALSSDGNTAMIGGGSDHGRVGAAWVFTRSGSTWTQQGSKLTGTGESGEGAFGVGVALSSDGNTALIGGSGDNANVGAAWVFTRSGSIWTQQGSKLTGTGESGKGGLGNGVALSSDGNTALIGGWNDNKGVEFKGVGAAWVFTRSGSTWTQQGSKLTGTGEVGEGDFGVRVALSSDGNIALIGGFADNGPGGKTVIGVGAAWVFTRSGSTWTQQGSKLTGSGEVGEGDFGTGVALSSDGKTALVGGSGDNGRVGAAWVFVDAPAVTGVSPATGPTVGGTTVSITGSALSGASAVKFGSTSASSFKVNSETSIEATSPAGSGTVDVIVTTSGGSSATSSADQFTYVTPPTIGNCTPSVTQTSATLCGTVNPNGSEVAECKFEYGTTTSYGSSAPCMPAPGSGTSPVEVSASVTGLTPNTRYHFRVSATNAGGMSKGADETFKTLHTPPFVETKAASSVAQTSATLNGSVKNAGSGGELLECKFEYGTTTSYGSSAPAKPCPSGEPEPGPGENVPLSAPIAGLAPNTSYHFRVSATNLGGTSKGSDQSFTTPPASHWYSNGVPVGSEAVTIISWGTIALKTVVGGSGEVTCHTVAAGTVRNPEPFATNLGVGSTQVWSTFQCESTTCPFNSVVTAGSLPWASAVEREGTSTRIKTTALNVKIDCQKEGKSEGSETFAGAPAPTAKHGTSSLHPGFVEYDAGAGTLEKEGSKGTVLDKLEGEVKVLGYDEQELINVN
jgi:hypothetical protein